MNSSGPSPRKMKKLENEGSEEIDENIRQAVVEIDGAQKELHNLNEKASKEIVTIKKNYDELRKPFYDKRATIIDRIPNFWLKAMLKFPKLSMLIDEEEEDCLRFLKKLEFEKFENGEKGFRIKFIFEQNPYFDNQYLIKEFQLGLNRPKSTSTTIQWKENMDLSKKQKETFFSWFSDNSTPAADYTAAAIKNELWVDAGHYFLMANEDSDDKDGDEGDEEHEVSADKEAVAGEIEEGEEQDEKDDQ